MKKLLSLILILGLAVGMVAGASVFADDDITVELDGKIIEFDVKPEIVDGRTMVPLRKIFEEIGALVKWNNDTKTVSARKNSKTITLAIDSKELQIDKGKTDDEGNPIIETVELEVPAQSVSGRTLVPARAVSESFGLNVEWDGWNKKVVITSDDKEDESWKENKGSINLSNLTYEGKGVEISGNRIKITEGGDFELKGKLDGNITISAKEKVKLRLSGAEITSETNPCIFVEKADKAYITLTDGTQNSLIAKNSEDGAIYSKENLEIKGDGSVEIQSLAGHGIKASDNLNIENGNIVISATTDGIHINDTFKMTGGMVDITALCDGIDSESIVNISGGTIKIETNGTPIETVQETETATENPWRGMWQDEADVEFEKSTKGINAEWMMYISGGEISINSASHAIHCQDEIQIDGGKFELSSKYDKGISAHGNLTISGAETTIDVIKSTEGIESKNVMTINDGTIKIISDDDAINATGGNSGTMMPGGGFGGNGKGGERVMPEGFGRGQRTQGNGANTENREMQEGQGMRPPRGGNGGASNMQPPFERGENGEFVPPSGIPQNGENAPNFGRGENGEFVPPTGMPWGDGFAPADGERPQMGEGAMPGGFMGGTGRDMKTCLVINGGYIEVYGGDDCIDTNGNLTINGGTVMASYPSGSFTGNFGVLDSDGKLTIGENATLLFATGSGTVRNMGTAQNMVVVYCEKNHEAGDKITVSDSKGNVVYEYTPDGNYKTILLVSGGIKNGEKYSITAGDEKFETEITQQSTVVGTQTSGGMGFERGQGMWTAPGERQNRPAPTEHV